VLSIANCKYQLNGRREELKEDASHVISGRKLECELTYQNFAKYIRRTSALPFFPFFLMPN
jgi:hypothetical protein